jgi:pimeloyl-ACP methyl ester carboxylesterase
MIINTACVSFRESDRKVLREFKKITIKPEIYRENYQGKTIRYISTKPIDNSIPTILFIHGAPGSAGNYFEYLKDVELGKKANLISIDRLGYGYSDFGKAETSLEKQAESIYTISKKHKLTDLILVGWSYGVPIAAKMAYKYPEVKHSVLVAGAISPEDEKFFGIAKMARWKLTKWMVPKSLRIADEEKMTHVEELTNMLSDWNKIKTPITYYHGTKDKLVPYKNMAFIISKVNDSLLKAVTLKEANHFILFKNYDMVKKELLEVLNSLDN